MQKATFAAGCFWGVAKAFRLISGVVDTNCSGKFRKPIVTEVVPIREFYQAKEGRQRYYG